MPAASCECTIATRFAAMLDPGRRITRYSRDQQPDIVMHRRFALMILTACAGCSIQPTVVADNYLTYDYAIADQVDAAIAKSPKALIVTPTDESALQRSLDQAKRDGMKIVLSDTTTEDPSVAESSVTGDNVKVGAMAFVIAVNAAFEQFASFGCKLLDE